MVSGIGEFTCTYSDPGFSSGGLPLPSRRRFFRLQVTGKNVFRFLQREFPDRLEKLRCVKIHADGQNRSVAASMREYIAKSRPYLKSALHIRAELAGHWRRAMVEEETEEVMVPRILRLHPKTYKRLVRLREEAKREGAHRVAKRLHAVLLNAQGYSSGEVAEILDAARSRVSEWLANYEAEGLEGLLEGLRSGRPPRLTPEELVALGDILESGPVAYSFDSGVWTSPMVARVIEEEQ